MTLVKKNGKGLIPSVFSDFFDTDTLMNPRWFNWGIEDSMPAVNIKESDAQFDIEMAAPGFEKSDFKINVDNDVLTISAEKQDEKKEETKEFRRREFSYNSFSRSFTLPTNTMKDSIEAAYDKGVLNLKIPKSMTEPTSPKKEITIK